MGTVITLTPVIKILKSTIMYFAVTKGLSRAKELNFIDLVIDPYFQSRDLLKAIRLIVIFCFIIKYLIPSVIYTFLTIF